MAGIPRLLGPRLVVPGIDHVSSSRRQPTVNRGTIEEPVNIENRHPILVVQFYKSKKNDKGGGEERDDVPV